MIAAARCLESVSAFSLSDDGASDRGAGRRVVNTHHSRGFGVPVSMLLQESDRYFARGVFI